VAVSRAKVGQPSSKSIGHRAAASGVELSTAELIPVKTLRVSADTPDTGDTMALSNNEAEPQSQSAANIATNPQEEPRKTVWVGGSVLFKGDLISLEDMTIDGRVEGTIEVRDHRLTIGPDAHINADIVAKTVTVLGSVSGTITTSEAVHIRESGSVEGNITCPRLAMADGAVLRGRVEGGSRSAAQEHPQPETARVRKSVSA
jgi:cytoskeletal protein CcmA (bactofilin family)